MILPTKEQMSILAPRKNWPEISYKNEIWKYDPNIGFDWECVRLYKEGTTPFKNSQGITVSGLHEQHQYTNTSNQVAQLIDLLYEFGCVIRITHNANITFFLADICPDKAFSKIIIIVESGARAICIDERNTTTHLLLCVSFEIHVHETAYFEYRDLQNLPIITRELRSFLFIAHKYSNIKLYGTYDGALYTKLFAKVRLIGQYAQMTMQYGSRVTGTQYHSIITDQSHEASYTKSSCVIRGALYQQARTMYYGRISIEKKGTKSEAFQQHKALLLSKQARVYALPTFEAQTNDVQCVHGSAVGTVDQDQLWYLQSRGIERENAEKILVDAFFSDLFTSDT